MIMSSVSMIRWYVHVMEVVRAAKDFLLHAQIDVLQHSLGVILRSRKVSYFEDVIVWVQVVVTRS